MKKLSTALVAFLMIATANTANAETVKTLHVPGGWGALAAEYGTRNYWRPWRLAAKCSVLGRGCVKMQGYFQNTGTGRFVKRDGVWYALQSDGSVITPVSKGTWCFEINGQRRTVVLD